MLFISSTNKLQVDIVAGLTVLVARMKSCYNEIPGSLFETMVHSRVRRLHKINVNVERFAALNF